MCLPSTKSIEFFITIILPAPNFLYTKTDKQYYKKALLNKLRNQ